jgi:pimeloyl-ACP methyl ester carboxylesterase
MFTEKSSVFHPLCVLQADRIQQLYPEAERVRLQSGHCPHDDTPEEANSALLAWLDRVYKR